SDYATIKYNSEGEELWVAHYNIPGNSYNIGRAIAVDASGNVYVTGQSDGIETTSDYATVKYNSDGEEQWVTRYHNDYDYSWAIATDVSGNVYVTGSSWGSGTQYDFATIKYVQYADLPDRVILCNPHDDVIVEISQENNNIQLEWHPSQPGEIYYYLEIATDPEFDAAHNFEELTDTVYIFTNMEDNQVYYWRVRAENDLGFSEYSDVWTFTAVMESGTFVQETEQPGVTLFPNPAQDHFTIHSDYLITHITIADLSGRVIYSHRLNNNEARIEKSWETGMYIVSITTAKGVFVRKLFIR
ncbi:MAG: T9SS type A sorting domain-containing protein, partial [Bacteroidales bacterium]|nr:T9SS type A sorting domain-containing protein [Bacteroidales bacterium]